MQVIKQVEPCSPGLTQGAWGQNSQEHLRAQRNMARTGFDDLYSELPRVKESPFKPKVGKSPLSDYFHENSTFGSTAVTQTARYESTLRNREVMSTTNRDFKVPSYFKPTDDNLFNRMTQKRAEPLEPTVFNLSSPDDRLSRQLYETTPSFMQDSMSTLRLAGTNLTSPLANDKKQPLAAKDTNYKIYMAKKLVTEE